MNEFSGKPKEQLEKMLLGLTSYTQGCEDCFKVMEENHMSIMKFYKEKIYLCESEIKNK